MERKISILVCYFLFHIFSICGQCIDKNIIWQRIVFLRDSSMMPAKDQLSELLQYENSITNCKYRTDSIRTLLLQRIGAEYYKLSDFLRAEKYIKSSIKIIKDSTGKSFICPGQLAKNYYILSVIYDSLDRPIENMEAEDSCISVSIQNKIIDPYLLYSIKKRVEYFYTIGDYHRCINYAKEGELITSKIIHHKDSLQYLLEFMTWKVNSLIFMNELEEAEKLLEEKTYESKTIDLSEYLGTVFERMAAIKIQKSKYKEALYFFNKSLKCDLLKKNYLSCLQTQVNMGFYLYNRINDSAQAIRCYKNAIYFASLLPENVSLSDPNLLKTQLLNIYTNIANVYARIGNYTTAECYFEKAFSLVNINLDNNHLYNDIHEEISKNNSIIYIISSLLDAGEFFLKKYKACKNVKSLSKAALIFTIADKLQFQNRTEQTEIQSKLFWRKNLRRLYENAIESFYLMGNNDAAFYFFERSRSILLNDQLGRQKLLNNDEIYRLGQLKKKILRLSRDLTSLNASSTQYKSLQNELFANNQELVILDQSIKNKNPLYYQTILDTSSIHLTDIQHTILKDHNGMLEIFNGDSAVYVLLITIKQVFFNKVEKDDFDKTSNLYTSYISDPVLINREYDQYLHVASHLFELIFQKTPIPNGRIIISEDGIYFPFEALIVNKNLSSPVYFLNDHIVSYTYSVRFLLNDFSKNSNSTTRNFLGIAPVRYQSVFNLAPLSESGASLEKISSYFGDAKMLVGSQATKSNFMNQFYGYKIIQLYTHASDSSSNGEPVIYFADSVLSLSELIPENKTGARLIVLSACETGNGKLYKGEGVFSFNRGFAALGIPSSLINLWAVENEPTYKITELFYKYVAEGLPLDIALQKAKLEFIKSSSKGKNLPYYWAAAILAGKTDAIELSTAALWKWPVIATGIILAGLVFFLVKRKGKPTIS
jgi:CHAT domain-containing protein